MPGGLAGLPVRRCVAARRRAGTQLLRTQICSPPAVQPGRLHAASYPARLLARAAGLSDGTLLLITNKAPAGQAPQWAVSDAVRGFGKRVSQLVAVHSKAMLLSLTEEGG